jgi:hypothetical protein
MAGTRSARETFTGEAWSDQDGTTYELEHQGRVVRLRFFEDGKIHFATKGEPLMLARCALGSGVIDADAWQNVDLRPQSR